MFQETVANCPRPLASQRNKLGFPGNCRDWRPGQSFSPSCKKTLAASSAVLAADVVAAVESLYADQLQPWGWILWKRLCERRGSDEVDLDHVRRSCKGSEQLQVKSRGGRWFVVIVDRPGDFIDFQSAYDPYPATVWAELCHTGAPLPTRSAGNYGMACALRARNLPNLRDLSLGQLCHLVQLADRRNLLSHSRAHGKNDCRMDEHISSCTVSLPVGPVANLATPQGTATNSHCVGLRPEPPPPAPASSAPTFPELMEPNMPKHDWTRSTLAVRHTFVHIGQSLWQRAATRSKSLPRHYGSMPDPESAPNGCHSISWRVDVQRCSGNIVRGDDKSMLAEQESLSNAARDTVICSQGFSEQRELARLRSAGSALLARLALRASRPR